MRAAAILLALLTVTLVTARGVLPDRAVAEPPADTRASIAPLAAHRLFVPAASSDNAWDIFEISDPDESGVLRNDIGSVRVARSSLGTYVAIRSAHPDGFSFEGGRGVVAAWFLFIPWVEFGSKTWRAEVMVTGPEIEMRAWAHGGVDPVSEFRIPWAGEGTEIAFFVPSGALSEGGYIGFRAAGSDSSKVFDANCNWNACADEDLDFAPGIEYTAAPAYKPEPECEVDCPEPPTPLP